MNGMIRIVSALIIVLFLATNSFCVVIFDEDFESLTEGTTYGVITTIYDLSNNNIPILGGKVVEYSGNKLVELDGNYPAFTADMGIQLDIATLTDINEIKFDFYFDYNTDTQTALFAPTTLQVDLYLMDNGIMDTLELTSQKKLLNFNFNGIQDGLMDITPNPPSYPSPFNAHFSITNLAEYLADITTLNPGLWGFDGAFLIFTVWYPAEGEGLSDGDPYETKAYIDNIEISTAPIPEPLSFITLLTGIMTSIFLKAFRRK